MTAKQLGYVYFKIRKEKIEMFGERYFRMNYSNDTVVQVSLSIGKDMKRGRSNNIGVYTVSKMTLLSNYLAMNYAVPCNEKDFEINFEKVINFLR